MDDRRDGVTVIDDSYNADPASTAAAWRALATLRRRRRTLAVLGYLAELGEHEPAGHEQAGRPAAELGVDGLVVIVTPRRSTTGRDHNRAGEESRCG